MAIDTSKLQNNIYKLRKSLKKTRKTCTPDQVHKLRTRAKKFEASAEAFSIASKRRTRSILRALKRIRRKAGNVRDMDVLTSHLSSVHADVEQDCVVQLFEYLGVKRHKEARRLRKVADKLGPDLRKELKGVAKRVGQMDGKSSGGKQKQDFAEATGFALQVADDLKEPATLNRSNLHEYRLKIKKLEYALRMADSDGADSFVNVLDECKSAIGEWHDWEELIAIANDILDHGGRCQLKRQLKAISASKLDQALSMAEKMRRSYVSPANRSRKDGSNGRAYPNQAVLEATSALSTTGSANRKSA